MVTLDKVTQAYSGIDGRCCCGCSGKHYHKEKTSGHGGTKNDIRMIAKIFKIVEAAANAGLLEYEEETFTSTVVSERQYIIYHSQLDVKPV